MHIKTVAIEAFLSYEQLKMAEGMELSPGCNLILGKNGTGKSNFLQGKYYPFPIIWLTLVQFQP